MKHHLVVVVVVLAGLAVSLMSTGDVSGGSRVEAGAVAAAKRPEAAKAAVILARLKRAHFRAFAKTYPFGIVVEAPVAGCRYAASVYATRKRAAEAADLWPLHLLAKQVDNVHYVVFTGCRVSPQTFQRFVLVSEGWA